MRKLLLLFLFIALFGSAYGQIQTVQLYNEDFEGNNIPFTLNGSGITGANTGSNKWIINNQYNGAPVYPNTTPENQTLSGTIGLAPFSKYLHIRDTIAQTVQGISNANFNPLVNSKQFAYTTDGFCTLGFNDVNFTFFWLCQGNAGAYGEVYYSINNGPWVQTGLSQYNNQTLWKYEIIADPVFDNQANIRFGFNWVNGNSAPPSTMSFAIDDINVVGTYDQQAGVQITLPYVLDTPVCQGNQVLLLWQLSDSLCDGIYTYQLSDINGNFGPNPFNMGVTPIVDYETFGGNYVPIPDTLTPGCYKIRLNRTSPAPLITGVATVCFEVLSCPNTITTAPPGHDVVVLQDPDTVCAGSVIDVPFYSTGVFVPTSNTYVAQLSRPDGTFPANPPYTVLGAFVNSGTYDPTQGSPPGSVSGLIPDTVSEGCNYFIRVVANSPATIGTVYGPFCIKHCDVETNNKVDIHFCINELQGADTTITYTIHNYDSTAVYNGTNQFEVQVISSQSWQVINTAVLGAIVSIQSGTVTITIPNLSGLQAIGMQPGMYYLRIIGTDSNLPFDLNGTLIRLTIGAPSAFPPTVIPDAPYYCSGFMGIFFVSPDNSGPPLNSTYQWWSNGMNLVNGVPQPFFWDPVLFVNFFGSGTILYTVREYNNGCAGPAGDTVQVDLFGPPNIGILGPNKVCKGDTVSYNVLFTNNTYYEWSTNPSTTIVDTSNNIIKVVFDSVGSNQIGVLIVNPCGNDQGTKTILVKDYPPAAAGLDQVVCAGTPVTLTANNLSGVSYTWGYVGGAEIGSGNPKVVTPNDTTTYYVKVKLNLTPPGCASYDTITVFTESPPPPVVDTLHICFGETATLAADTGQGYTYLWNTGETSQIISKTDSGTYQVDITMPGEVCAKTQIFLLDVDTCYIPLKLPNVFTPNGDGANDFWIPYPIGNFDKFEIIVYNRWGTVVFKTTDPKFKWDAKDLNGDLVSEGVYYYVATTQYVDKHQELHGTVSVLNEKK